MFETFRLNDRVPNTLTALSSNVFPLRPILIPLRDTFQPHLRDYIYVILHHRV